MIKSPLLKVSLMLKKESWKKNSMNHDRNEVLRITLCSNSV